MDTDSGGGRGIRKPEQRQMSVLNSLTKLSNLSLSFSKTNIATQLITKKHATRGREAQ